MHFKSITSGINKAACFEEKRRRGLPHCKNPSTCFQFWETSVANWACRGADDWHCGLGLCGGFWI